MWTLGSFASANMRDVLLVGAALPPGCFFHGACARPQRRQRRKRRAGPGVNAPRVRLAALVLATLMTAAAVSVSGIIGFGRLDGSTRGAAADRRGSPLAFAALGAGGRAVSVARGRAFTHAVRSRRVAGRGDDLAGRRAVFPDFDSQAPGRARMTLRVENIVFGYPGREKTLAGVTLGSAQRRSAGAVGAERFGQNHAFAADERLAASPIRASRAGRAVRVSFAAPPGAWRERWRWFPNPLLRRRASRRWTWC